MMLKYRYRAGQANAATRRGTGEENMTVETAGANEPQSHAALSHLDAVARGAQDFLLLAGRILIGWIFVQSGWRKLMDISGFVATMPRRGLPDFLGYVAPFVEFFGGLAVLLGCATRYAAVLMLLFTIIASFSSHRYWDFTDPAQRSTQHTQFWKNVSMMGGIVLLFVAGAGRLSLDHLLRRFGRT
jgi:putative oxidoreductase